MDFIFQEESLQKNWMAELLSFPNKANGIAIKAPMRHHKAKDCPNAIIINKIKTTKRRGFVNAFLIFSLLIIPIKFVLNPPIKDYPLIATPRMGFEHSPIHCPARDWNCFLFMLQWGIAHFTHLCPCRDLNPGPGRERAVSWTTRLQGHRCERKNLLLKICFYKFKIYSIMSKRKTKRKQPL